MQIKTSIPLLALFALPLAAQEVPLSAIDWLAVQRDVQSVISIQPELIENPVATNASVPDVDVQSLDAPMIGAVGLLPSSMTGLPNSLWQNSSESDVIAAMKRLQSHKPSVPALDSLLHTLLLAEAAPPADGDGEQLLEVRLDTLYDHGLVAAAEALVARIRDLTPGLFAHAFNLSLLTGSDEALCQVLNDQPNLNADLSIRIWCATRDGDFPLAVTIYQTGSALGQLSTLDSDLLLRFLDPEFAEDAQTLRPPVRPTPLQFRLFEAIGEALPTTPLPLPFAVVELTGDSGWRAQLQAAERLARAGAIDGNLLLGVYTDQLRAASGGIWDRVDALQRFETALSVGDPGAISSSLEKVWPQMRAAGLLVPFSNLFASQLQGLPLSERALQIANNAGFLSEDYETVAQSLAESTDDELSFLSAIANGDTSNSSKPDLPHVAALSIVWSQDPIVPAELPGTASKTSLGEALLVAIQHFEEGAEGNASKLTDSLQTLRAFGLENTARRAALQLAILDMESSRQ